MTSFLHILRTPKYLFKMNYEILYKYLHQLYIMYVKKQLQIKNLFYTLCINLSLEYYISYIIYTLCINPFLKISWTKRTENFLIGDVSFSSSRSQ